MTGPAATGALAVRSLHAMASSITLTVVDPGPTAQESLDRAEAVLREVERTCSRFDERSDLVRVNRAPDQWHEVPATLAAAIAAAGTAHRETGGLFDPRILATLVSWGYDRSLPFAGGSVVRTTPGAPTPPADLIESGWRPEVTHIAGTWRLRLGDRPVDLGGIGKGLATRWAAAELAGAGAGFLVEAGGDCAVGGIGPDGGAWRVGVEDPAGGPEPVLALELRDTGCATSSVRVRTWLANGEQVHHLVDPRTGRPGDGGLRSVTVVMSDPAWSEVHSKALFLGGAHAIARRADELGLAAAWVRTDGVVGTSGAMDPLVVWRCTRG